jgi:hypothetical protein
VQGAFCLTPNSLVIFSTLAKNLNRGQNLWYAVRYEYF